MKLNDFLVMIGLKLLVIGYLENTLRYTTPFKNSEKSVKTQSESEFRQKYFHIFSPPENKSELRIIICLSHIESIKFACNINTWH